MELPIRDVMSRFIRPLDPAFELLLELEGVRDVMELPIFEVKPELTRLFELWLGTEPAGEELLDPLLRLDTEEVLPVMELPIRDVVLRPIPLLRLVPGELVEFDVDGVLPVIELPTLEVRPEPCPPAGELIRPDELLFDEPREMDGDAFGVLTDGPALGDLDDTDGRLVETGVRDVIVRLERVLPRLRVVFSVLEREDIDGPGVTLLTELLRLDEIADRELTGDCIERELTLLPRLWIEGLGARIEGVLTLGAGAGLGAGRLAERLLPELEPFCSFFAAKTGAQIRIKAEMSTRIPILTAF